MGGEERPKKREWMKIIGADLSLHTNSPRLPNSAIHFETRRLSLSPPLQHQHQPQTSASISIDKCATPRSRHRLASLAFLRTCNVKRTPCSPLHHTAAAPLTESHARRYRCSPRMELYVHPAALSLPPRSGNNTRPHPSLSPLHLSPIPLVAAAPDRTSAVHLNPQLNLATPLHSKEIGGPAHADRLARPQRRNANDAAQCRRFVPRKESSDRKEW
ncbi:hypothetical protein R3P38DRAFT_1413005 [Favolaschia claudopus]|uniref:Uncharacterized protein n=1 Tax=Favolaschia claudopus TaxID=2862362 RepID=A0AAW0ANB5_9AGAR